MCRACDRELGDFTAIPVFDGRMTEIDIWQSTIKMKERERERKFKCDCVVHLLLSSECSRRLTETPARNSESRRPCLPLVSDPSYANYFFL